MIRIWVPCPQRRKPLCFYRTSPYFCTSWKRLSWASLSADRISRVPSKISRNSRWPCRLAALSGRGKIQCNLWRCPACRILVFRVPSEACAEYQYPYLNLSNGAGHSRPVSFVDSFLLANSKFQSKPVQSAQLCYLLIWCSQRQQPDKLRKFLY